MKKRIGIIAAAVAAAVVLAVVIFAVARRDRVQRPTTELPSAAESARVTRAAAPTQALTEGDAAPAPTTDSGFTSFLPEDDENLEKLGVRFSGNTLLNALTLTLARYDLNGDQARFTIDFDTASGAAADVLFRGARCPLYDYLYRSPEQREFTPATDPFGADGEHLYTVYQADLLNELARRTLNLEPIDFSALTRDDLGGVFRKYENGEVWMANQRDDVTSGLYARAREMKQDADGVYTFTVDYQRWAAGADDKPVDGTGTLVAELQEADGETYWAIRSYHAELTIPE